jgi:hypothetical protein
MRVDLSAELFRLVEQQECRTWQDLIAMSESWFYFCRDYELRWLAPREKIPESGETRFSRQT